MDANGDGVDTKGGERPEHMQIGNRKGPVQAAREELPNAYKYRHVSDKADTLRAWSMPGPSRR